MSKAESVAVTYVEGGMWHPHPQCRGPDLRVHSVLFENGEIWDALNGWRKQNVWQWAENKRLARTFRSRAIDATGWAEAAFEQPITIKFPPAFSAPYTTKAWVQLERGYP